MLFDDVVVDVTLMGQSMRGFSTVVSLNTAVLHPRHTKYAIYIYMYI